MNALEALHNDRIGLVELGARREIGHLSLFEMQESRDMTLWLVEEHLKLLAAVRKCRDYRGDDRCWKDLRELFSALPEGYTPPKEDTAVELENCRRYITAFHDPATTYVSPQRKIEELNDQIVVYNSLIRMMYDLRPSWPQEFVDLAVKMETEGPREKAIDLVMKQIDHMLRLGQMEACDKVLDAVDVTKTSPTLCITYLSITLAAREHLRRRDALYDRVNAHFTDLPNKEKILRGLK